MKAIATVVACMCFSVSGAHAASGTIDQGFVTEAGQGGLAEVALGKMAAQKGKDSSIRNFGKHMVDDHAKANEELASAASSGGASVPSAPSKTQQAMAAKLDNMSGNAFDAAYAKAMVKDHKDTIALFEKESKSGRDADLKAFATKTLPTLKEHLQMAEALKQ